MPSEKGITDAQNERLRNLIEGADQAEINEAAIQKAVREQFWKLSKYVPPIEMDRTDGYAAWEPRYPYIGLTGTIYDHSDIIALKDAKDMETYLASYEERDYVEEFRLEERVSDLTRRDTYDEPEDYEYPKGTPTFEKIEKIYGVTVDNDYLEIENNYVEQLKEAGSIHNEREGIETLKFYKNGKLLEDLSLEQKKEMLIQVLTFHGNVIINIPEENIAANFSVFEPEDEYD
jgi:hypothetical protein